MTPAWQRKSKQRGRLVLLILDPFLLGSLVYYQTSRKINPRRVESFPVRMLPLLTASLLLAADDEPGASDMRKDKICCHLCAHIVESQCSNHAINHVTPCFFQVHYRVQLTTSGVECMLYQPVWQKCHM